MDQRLLNIFDLIDHNARGVCDVGTDHGLIPINLALNGFSGDLIATDINEGPLRRAMENARSHSVYERITFCRFDGLPACLSAKFDTAVIAGMGGDLICSILDRADWIFSENYVLILQPMSKPEVLRYYLVNNGFDISDDVLAEDNGRTYQIIRCRFTGVNDHYADAELYLGKKCRCNDLKLYDRSSAAFRKVLEKIIHGSLSSGDTTKSTYYINMAQWFDNIPG